jgi:hypothetical protein
LPGRVAPAHSRQRTPVSPPSATEIRELKEAYEARIRALERRLAEAEARAAQPPVPAPAVAPVPATSASSTASAFNPAISVVLQGRYANLSRSPSEFAIAGFATGEEAGPGRRGFSLASRSSRSPPTSTTGSPAS